MPSSADLKTELFLGGAGWTDITKYARQQDGILITRGRQNEAATMQPSSVTMKLTNDGRFTTRNPTGAYWPNLVQNTPLRMSVPIADAGLGNYLRFEGDSASYASCPDSVGLDITAILDARVDVWLTDYQNVSLIGKWSATAANKSWIFDLRSDGTLEFYWYDGAAQHHVNSAAPLPYFGQRIALRVVFTAATGTAVFYTAPTMAGAWTQLGPAVTYILGATTLNAGTGTAIQVGATTNGFNGCLGMVYEARILSNVTLEASPLFSAQAAGVTSFADGQGNTWTLNGTAEISNRSYRYHGELGSIPKTSDTSQRNVSSQATAYGVTRRLQNSNTPLQSAMRRAYLRLPASLNLGAYWSCEDGTAATSIGSSIGGGSPLPILGSPNLASFAGFACSLPIPVMNGGTFLGNITPPAGVTWTDISIRFLLAVPAGGETNGAILMQAAYSGGSFAAATLVYGTGGTLNMTTYDTGGNVIATTGNVSFGVNGQLLRVAMDLKKNGTGVDMQIATVAVGATTAGLFTHTVASSTVGVPTRIQAGSLSSPVNVSAIGHISVQGNADTIFDLQGALSAWNGEAAATRVARLLSEEGIASRIVGAPGLSMPMGTQPIATLLDVLQQCENTDLGMLFEPRQCLGIGYRTRSSMYHQTPTVTFPFGLPLSAGFNSTGDIQLTVNDVTAVGQDGSIARQFLAAGLMSVQAPPNGIGRVDTQINPSPQYDQNLNQIAAWYLFVRSIDDDRYPGIIFQMARAGTPAAVLLLDIGDFLQITVPPNWLPSGPISQLCAGFQEGFGPVPLWPVTVNGIPELPYETAQIGPMRFDTAGSTLTAGISNSATSFQVTTQAGSQPWTLAAGDFPFDIVVDREQMTVTNITGAASPQTFTVTRSVNGVVLAHSAGAAVALYHKPVYAL